MSARTVEWLKSAEFRVPMAAPPAVARLLDPMVEWLREAQHVVPMALPQVVVQRLAPTVELPLAVQ